MQRRHFLGSGALLATGLPGATSAWAQPPNYPAKPIMLLVPYGAGGPTDTHLRAVAEAAGKLLGQAMLIDNRPGANGVNGAAALPKAAPDGYTLAILPASVYREPFVQKTPFDPRTSFSYIAMLSDYAFGLAVRADSPWKQWKDFAADAKKRPGQINIGATGAVGTPRVVMDEAAAAAGLELNIVPYKGDADLANAILGGHVDAGPLSGVAAPHIAAGKMRYLVALTKDRIKRYADLPTLREQGVEAWIDSPYGVAGPAGMDPSLVMRLSDVFQQALNSPGSLRALDSLNQPLNYMDPLTYKAYALQSCAREEQRVAALRKRGLL